MQKRMSIFLLIIFVSLFFTGCGVPGIDYPIDKAAFWNPDIPDYADDGNVYSRKMLATGTVYDHLRELQNIKLVLNFATQIQNQLLNLQNLGTKLVGLEERHTQLKSLEQQKQGIMNPSSNWNDVYHSTNELETAQNLPSIQNNETILKKNNQTYQDALQQAMLSTQNEDVKSMIDQVNSQNSTILGNNQGKQNTNQGYAIKIIQQAEGNQSAASIISTIITAAEMKQQAAVEAYQNAKGVHVNVSDPYHPKSDEPARPQGKGFIQF